MKNFLVLLIFSAFAFSACNDEAAPISQSVKNKETDEENKKQVPECVHNFQCPKGECVENKCKETESCEKQKDCTNPERPLCSQNHCVGICVTDVDCGEGYQCFNGECEEYDEKRWDYPAAYGKGSSKSSFKYGFAEGRLDFPIGISMSGYGTRVGIQSPFQEILNGSNGYYDYPVVKVTVLDNGKNQLVLIRLPLSFSIDFNHARIAELISLKTGKKYLNNVVISATHSHSSPGRFWNLLPDGKLFKAVPLGIAGHGVFHKHFFERMMESIANTAVTALKNLKPGELAIEAIEPFDKDNKVFRNRRGFDDDIIPAPYKKEGTRDDKDARLVFWKITNKKTGKPVVGIFNFGMHGTHLNTSMHTGDAPGGLEWATTRSLAAKYGNSFSAVFINGSGGDHSPAGGAYGHNSVGKCQVVGYEFTELLGDKFDNAKATDDVDISIGDVRFPISYDLLGYKKPQFSGKKRDGSPDIYDFGAVDCAAEERSLENPHTDGELECLTTVRQTRDKQVPSPNLMKSHITAVSIDLNFKDSKENLKSMFFTSPGESTARFGRKYASAIKEKHNIDLVYNFGFSQDHFLYLPLEEQFWIGGYEASFTLWGWKFEKYLGKHIMKAAELSIDAKNKASKDGQENILYEFNSVKPSYWTKFEETSLVKFEPRAIHDPGLEKPFEAVPQILNDVKTEYKRNEIIRFNFIGGDPLFGAPDIILERQNSEASFETMRYPGTRIYDDSGFETKTKYYGKFKTYEAEDKISCKSDITVCDSWELTLREDHKFPTGKYRFKISGEYLKKDGKSAKKYQIFTSEFTLTNTDDLPIFISQEGSKIKVLTGYRIKSGKGNEKTFDDKDHVVYYPKNPPSVPPALAGSEKETASFSVELQKSGENSFNELVSGKLETITLGSNNEIAINVFDQKRTCKNQFDNCPELNKIPVYKTGTSSGFEFEKPAEGKLKVSVKDGFENSGQIEFDLKSL